INSDKQVSSFNCVLYDCRSVLNKLPVLESLQRFDPPDIIGHCETCLSNKVPDSLLSPNSKYNVLRSNKSCGMKGGGVAILTKRHFSFEGTGTLALNSRCDAWSSVIYRQCLLRAGYNAYGLCFSYLQCLYLCMYCGFHL
ncbi:hypothetical protein Tcan_01461, partial [Toxocara canis]